MKKRILLVGCNLLLGSTLLAMKRFDVDIVSLEDIEKEEENYRNRQKLAEKKLMENRKDAMYNPKLICDDIYIKEDKHPFDKFINGRKGKRK